MESTVQGVMVTTPQLCGGRVDRKRTVWASLFFWASVSVWLTKPGTTGRLGSLAIDSVGSVLRRGAPARAETKVAPACVRCP